MNSEKKKTEIKAKHLKLDDLKKEKAGETNRYLHKTNIPEYPKPEFHVNRLKHETTAGGLEGIWKDGGFRVPEKDLRDPDGESKISLMWWSLAVGPEEINDAEDRLLKETFPNRREVRDPEQQRFLWKFATSPAFKETSRVGSFRFTFSLEEVLIAYRKQFCSGAEPIMRVYKTVLHPQEVMYVVLVHSPDFNETFKDCPLLEDNPEAICVYRDGHFIWRAQAMCGTHW
ncbi:uncharacterized protein LOC119779025 [Cyprinodon tularosa]|uniref:uncharacterized protein LOC119779025 n=1 Tax=Cyprinodon tularosa TaxID=77115 RepID=UPI0018E2863D|nr:uncharacterized protein LOC119779025 [Cyprinodon tularosa]